MPGPRQRAEAAEPAQPPGPVPAETWTRPVSRGVFLLWSFSPSPLENGWEQSHGSWRALPTASPKRAGLVKACKKSGAPRATSGPPGSSTCVPVRREHFPPEVSGPVNGCARKPPAICHHDPSWNGSHRKCHAGIHRCCSEPSSAGLCVLGCWRAPSRACGPSPMDVTTSVVVAGRVPTPALPPIVTHRLPMP